MKKQNNSGASGFEKLSLVATKASGSTSAFIIAFFSIVVWLITGPVFNYSDTWQLVINTGTTIITFLMVFLIQRNQNKDSVAVHLKLNELIIAHDLASNRMVSIEDISEEELKVLQKFYLHLAQLANKDLPVTESHSINKANSQHNRKVSVSKTVHKKHQD